MSSTTDLSLEGSARLELEGSVSRLLLARLALSDFYARTAFVTSKESSPNAENSDSLERELRMLLTEEDEAKRNYDHAFAECLRLQKTPTPR
jgi:hypothetical protein